MPKRDNPLFLRYWEGGPHRRGYVSFGPSVQASKGGWFDLLTYEYHPGRFNNQQEIERLLQEVGTTTTEVIDWMRIMKTSWSWQWQKSVLARQQHEA